MNLNDETKKILDRHYLECFGMTTDEFFCLDVDEQERLISDYRQEHNLKGKKDKFVRIMIGGGDESIFVNVPKGKKILTPNGYYIAGESLEEYRIKKEQEETSIIGKSTKRKKLKLKLLHMKSLIERTKKENDTSLEERRSINRLQFGKKGNLSNQKK